MIKKEDVSILDKIRSFFKNIFSKKKQQSSINKSNEMTNFEKNTEFEKNLKTNVSNIYEREYKLNRFIKEIESNPDMLENLSSDRLDKLIDYYEKLTVSKEEKIEKLKTFLNKKKI